MSRILAIDYGTKRTGIAVSDPLQIIANGLDTVATKDLFTFLKKYIQDEEVECIVVGDSTKGDGSPSHISHLIKILLKNLEIEFPDVELTTFDEHLTSVRAKQIIMQSGANRKKRQNKALVDKISAVLILQDFMEYKRNGF